MYARDTSPTVLSMGWGRGVGFAFPVVVVAAFACIWLLVDSPAAHGASGSAHAAASKAKRSKACKKKRKRSAACKRRARRTVLPAAPRTVTLTWDSTANVDLKVFDLQGRYAGPQGGALVNGIPGATHSADDADGFGPETFNDPSGERVGYLACYVSGPYAEVTVTDSGAGGGTYTAGLGPSGSPGHPGAYTSSVGWGFLPIGAHC